MITRMGHTATNDCFTSCINGKLFIVSIGPGDAEHLTLKAVQTLKKADVIFGLPEDALKVQELIDGKTALMPEEWDSLWLYNGIAWADSPSLFCGKEWMRILKEKQEARDDYVRKLESMMDQGKNLVMLDSGDLTLYNRFIFWLIEGIDRKRVEIVPGVCSTTAAFAALKSCPTGNGSRFVVQTDARSYLGKDGEKRPVEAFSGCDGTLVFYMSLDELPDLVNVLKTFKPYDRPVAVVYHAGNREKENVVCGTLDTILSLVEPKEDTCLGLIVVGRCLSGTVVPMPEWL